MALLTVSTESVLTEAGNYVLTASAFHGLAANFGFCACVLHVTRHSTLARLARDSALAEAQNSVLTASVFHGLAANFGFCMCVLRVTRDSTPIRLAQKFSACK